MHQPVGEGWTFFELPDDVRVRAGGYGKDPRCMWEYAGSADLDAKCVEPMPVGCFALGIICTLSIFATEKSAGELFIFSAGCGNTEFDGLSLNLDDPLGRLLFEGEATVYERPKCA